MKILYIVNARIPTENAHGVQLMHTCEALSRAGAMVELVVPRRWNPIRQDPYEYYSLEKVFKITRLPTLDLIRFGSVGYWIQEKTFCLSAIVYILLARRSWVLYIRGEKILPMFSFLHRFGKLFVETHIKPANFSKYLPLYRKVAGITVVTGHYAGELVAAGISATRVLVAPDGVDLRLFPMTIDRSTLRQRLDLPKNKSIAAYIGKLTTMGNDKGVEALFEAFASVIRRAPASLLLIVGAQPEELALITTMATNKGLPASSFKVVGHVHHAEAAAYMQAANILVMNYPDAQHYRYYMSPLKLFEYMASGKVIVSSDLDSVRDIISDRNAVLITPDDTELLAKTLVDVIQNPSKYSARAVQARKDVEKYSWEERAKSILRFITSLIHESNYNSN